MTSLPDEPRFVCDAMLGSLARWLRAAGYDVAWQADIDDWDLIRLARREQRVLLSSDTGIFKIGSVRDGDLPGLWVPHGLTTEGQLAFVLERLALAPREPRCMACGGALVEVPKEQVRDRVPPRTFAWQEQYHQCSQCGQVFWQGTHWPGIAGRLAQARSLPS